MKTQGIYWDFREPVTPDAMEAYLKKLEDRYPFVGVTSLGESVLGQRIPLVTVGEGKKAMLYVGAHSGTEWMTCALLLRFLGELAEGFQNAGKAFGYSLKYLLSVRTICVVPMLNPDGVEYVLHGIAPEHILYDRVHAMNGGNESFSDWKANARGVELVRNYAYGFVQNKRREMEMGIFGGAPFGFGGEMSESEPETAALCRFLRCREGVSGTLSLHIGERAILYTAGTKIAARSAAIGGAMARMTKYPLLPYYGFETVGGMSAWCIDELNVPGFSIACNGTGGVFDEAFLAYTELREMLFTLPTMI